MSLPSLLLRPSLPLLIAVGVGLGPAAVTRLPMPPEPSLVAAALLPAPLRLAGSDRYEQAALVARTGFPSAGTVYLASGERFPDALSAAAVAGRHAAPLLLTRADDLPPGTAAEIVRLHPELVVVVGGELSIDDAVLERVSRLTGGVTVVRIGGVDRYAVSRALVGEPSIGLPHTDELFVATGATYPDALAAAPAAVRAGSAVLLVDGGATAVAPSERMLLHGLGARAVRVVGGPASVGPALEADLRGGWAVRRHDGPDRYAVAVVLNDDLTAARTVYLASGEAFPDALSGAPLAAAAPGGALYLVRRDCVPPGVLADLERLRPTAIVLLGGTLTLTDDVRALRSC